MNLFLINRQNLPLYEKVLKSRFHLSEKNPRIPPNTFYIGAEENGQNIGIAILQIEEDTAFLQDIYIQPDLRNIGLGSRFLIQLTDHLRDSGLKDLVFRWISRNENDILRNWNFFENHEFLIYANLLKTNETLLVGMKVL